MSVHKEAKRITTQVVHEMKQSGEKIAMLTAYDYTMATVVDQAGVDIILVGDSAYRDGGSRNDLADHVGPNDLPRPSGRSSRQACARGGGPALRHLPTT